MDECCVASMNTGLKTSSLFAVEKPQEAVCESCQSPAGPLSPKKLGFSMMQGGLNMGKKASIVQKHDRSDAFHLVRRLLRIVNDLRP